MPIHCILLRDHIATEKHRGLPYDTSKEVQALKGSLWVYNEDTHKNSSTHSKHILASAIDVKSGASKFLNCETRDLANLSEEQCELLKSVSTCEDRYKVFQDKSWLSEAIQIKVGTTVYVLKLDQESSRLIGKVRYKGYLPESSGTLFGVELSKVSLQTQEL